MLVDDINAVLPQLRAEAEALMVDACKIERQTGTAMNPDPPFDEVPTWETVYEGKCRVQVQDRVVPVEPDAGGRAWTVEQLQLQLPIPGTEGIRIGDSATVTAAVNDADLVGRVYVVRMTHAKTHATARRLGCEEVVS